MGAPSWHPQGSAPWRPRGLVAGALLGVLCAIASGLLAPQGAPPAYGLCVACHGKDLLAGLGLRSLVGAPGASGLVLSTVGLLLGAFAAARLHGEHRRRPARHPLRAIALGAATMCASLLALGCTSRIALRAAYGDPLALWSGLGVALAIAGYTGALRWQARRSVGGASS